MNKQIKLLLMSIMLLVSTLAMAQSKVTGKVVDSNGEPIIGANVVVEGTNIGAATDLNGIFTLTKVKQGSTIKVSFIGYKPFSLVYRGKGELNVIKLMEDSQMLNDVVVVGFGVQKKVNVTGSVGQVTSKQLENRPVTNVSTALQGMLPGLNVTSTGNPGTLNATKSINVRGVGTIGSSSGSPLVLIDGMEGDMNTLNPDDIESISVLKDAASSAIYGARAPFGVILITTKTGKEGAPRVSYNFNIRLSNPIRMPQMQNSWEFVNYYDDAKYNQSRSHWYINEQWMNDVHDYFLGNLDQSKAAYGPGDSNYHGTSGKWDFDHTYGNVDWVKEYYRNLRTSMSHTLSVSGGTAKTSYYVSGEYMNENGFMRYNTDNYVRYNLNGKIQTRINKFAKIDFSTGFVRTQYNRPTAMNDGFFNNVMRRARPNRPITDPNGFYMDDINYVDVLKNGGDQREDHDRLTTQLRLTVTPLKDWNIIGEFNMRTDNNWTHYTQFPVSSHYASDPTSTYVSGNTSLVSKADGAAVYEYAYRSVYMNPTIYTNYHIQLDKHYLAATAGFQFEKNNYRDLSAYRDGLLSNDVAVINMTTDKDAEVMSGQYQKWAAAGYFGRLNYDYDGRYLFEVDLRYDGSSRFRSDSRWVLSPSASIGWNIAKEKFFEGLSKDIQTLKLRASYGQLANQNTNGWYPTYQTLSVGASNSSWLVNGSKVTTATVPGLVSSSLTWEKVRTTNFGLDWGILNNRLTGSFDYYIRKTIGMVGSGVELPATLGTAVPATNNMDLKTYGWELELAWRDRIKDFQYGVRLNISDERTKVTKYPNETGSLSSYQEGQVTGNIWGYTTIGIAKTDDEMNTYLATLTNGGQNALGSNWAAGDIMYADINGDGKINKGSNTLADHGDLKIIGNTTPHFLTGLNIDASWKGIDCSMFWQGVLKRDYFPTGMMFWGMTSSGEWWSTALKQHLDYFRAEDTTNPFGPNVDAYYPRPLMGNGKNQNTQTKYLQNAAYMRLKNLQIGYTLPETMTKRFGISKLRVFFSGENLLTITSLSKTLDPEYVGIGYQGGTVYPMSRTFSFGLNVNF